MSSCLTVGDGSLSLIPGAGRAKASGLSGGKFFISFTGYESSRVICCLSLIKWLLFVADVTHARETWVPDTL